MLRLRVHFGSGRLAALLLFACLGVSLSAGCAAAEPMTGNIPEPTACPVAEPLAAPEPTAAPTPTPVPEPTPFSLLWMSDTQRTAGHRGEFALVRDWCMEQIEPYNIVALLHTGDVVDSRVSEFQWSEAMDALTPIREALPSLLIAGNHDMHPERKNYEFFRSHIYKDGAPADSYNRGQGSYLLLEAGGIDWMFVGMSYQYLDAELDWLSEVLSRYPERTAVLLLHEYMDGHGTLLGQGERVMERVIKPHGNVKLVLCGHRDGFCTRTDVIDTRDGETVRTVQSVICNMQSDAGRRGTVQILTIDPAAETIALYAYSPVRYEAPPIETMLPLDMN